MIGLKLGKPNREKNRGGGAGGRLTPGLRPVKEEEAGWWEMGHRSWLARCGGGGPAGPGAAVAGLAGRSKRRQGDRARSRSAVNVQD